ncbi:hypothetical protein Prudu_003404 [Prunus dulcis]|uniref:DM13 domain-containing protein n=1 Tax=Prunus dulcis TaxID=3755 RepID=A0A4Y1QT22_PRUDU|nr:hypothetical protein Prudu_003404 [Prunus dulcis]
MVQHQLRGSIKIIDDCSFKVSDFDMLPGSDVQWWGAAAPDFTNLSAGFVVSDQKLNETYKSASFTVRLRDNVTWDRIQVLAVWDRPTASDFGHVILGDFRSGSSDPAPSPSPSSATGSGNGTGRVHTEPTMLENCKVLSKNYRVRWTLNSDENIIDIGLEPPPGL